MPVSLPQGGAQRLRPGRAAPRQLRGRPVLAAAELHPGGRPHRRTAPAGCGTSGTAATAPPSPYNLPAFDLAAYHRRYCETIRGLDDSTGRVLEYLDEAGLAGDTLVIYLGDNGFQFGEQGLIDKRTAYAASIRIPLIARWPAALPAGTTVTQTVANIDLAATVLDACGAEDLVTTDGRSFLPLLRWRAGRVAGVGPLRIPLGVELPPHAHHPRGAAGGSGNTSATTASGTRTSCSDTAADPHETVNLIASAEHQGTVAGLRAELFRLLRQTGGDALPLKPDRGAAFPWRRPERPRRRAISRGGSSCRPSRRRRRCRRGRGASPRRRGGKLAAVPPGASHADADDPEPVRRRPRPPPRRRRAVRPHGGGGGPRPTRRPARRRAGGGPDGCGRRGTACRWAAARRGSARWSTPEGLPPRRYSATMSEERKRLLERSERRTRERAVPHVPIEELEAWIAEGSGVTAAVIDANVFVYAVAETGSDGGQVKEVLRVTDEARGAGVVRAECVNALWGHVRRNLMTIDEGGGRSRRDRVVPRPRRPRPPRCGGGRCSFRPRGIIRPYDTLFVALAEAGGAAGGHVRPQTGSQVPPGCESAPRRISPRPSCR